MKKVSIALCFVLPTYAFAADKTSDLKNQSDPKTGYYLVQDKIWAKNGCVITPAAGNKKINPGDTDTLKVKDGCKWGVVTYNIFQVSDSKKVGEMAHSYRDGSFNIDIKADCSGDACTFYDLNPQQNR